MSYLRYGWPLKYVEAESEDYVYVTGYKKEYVEDYGGISDNGLVELCCKAIDEYYKDDPTFKEYLMKKLAKRLKVKLRKRPLTDDEIWDLFWK